MANLIVNLNNYNDSKCEIIVNGIDIFKNQKRIPITKSGTYKINIIIYNTMKIKNKFHFNLKNLLPYFPYFYRKEVESGGKINNYRITSWDNYIDFISFDFNATFDENLIERENIFLNVNFDFMGKQNYIGGNDFYNYPQVLSNDEIEITDIELNEKKILNKSNYKRNQFLLCVTQSLFLLFVGILSFVFIADCGNNLFYSVISILVIMHSVYTFVRNIIRLYRYIS